MALLPLSVCVLVVLVPLIVGIGSRRWSRLGGVLYVLGVVSVIAWTTEGAPLADGTYHRPEMFPEAHWAVAAVGLGIVSCATFLLRGRRNVRV